MKGMVDSYRTPAGARRWRARWEELPDGITGKRRQATRAGFATRRDAETFLLEVRTRLASGASVGTERDRLGPYLTRWLAGIKVRPTTLSNYTSSLRYVIAELGGMRLRDVTPEHLDVLYRKLEREGRSDGTGLAPKTVRHVHAAIHAALQDAVERGHLPRNPATLAHPPSQRASRSANAREKTWDREQLRTFLSHARDHELHALWRLVAMTGMRRGEALGLRWDAVNLDDSSIHVSRTVTEVNGQLIEGDSPKTDAGERTITLDPETVTILRQHRRAQTEQRLAAGPAWADEVGAVFTRADGSRLRPSSVSSRFSELVRAAGLPAIGVHGLRHTHATLSLGAGVPVHVVSRRLGHADAAVTLRLYAHAIPGDDRSAAAAFARAVLDG